ncbi:MAG TPA: hybrid sensor histidine kinase/response regulator, partial [Tepidisphaeraceae bacterium]|nr:hybrid sensor histidine kinase/response regulator [Tepidisphaeraceae bacterium]
MDLRLLLVEDSQDDGELVQRYLVSGGFKPVCRRVCTAPAVRTALAEENWDLVISDFSMPQFSGLAALALVKERDSDIPFILVSGTIGEAMAVEAMKAGAADYILKDDLARLAPAVRRELSEAETRRARKQAEAQLRRSEARKTALLETLARKNEKLAELYDNAQRFVDNVSHEFRTPLTVIKGYAEAMAEGMAGPVSTEQCEFLGFIIDRTRDLAQMVDDLLDSSKLRAGTLRIDRRAVEVEHIISEVRPMLHRTAAANKIQLVERIDDPLPLVFADAEKAARTIVNLVVNAIKFSREATQVKLWARKHRDGGVEIGVSDHGPGIAPEELNLIFERFKQVGDPHRSSTKGFGLGLNIAKEMVALNLGEMRVTSRVGKGSTFSFTLPPNDPAIVLRRHLDYMSKVGAGNTMTILRVGFEPGQPISDEVRSFVASSVSPLDLILDGDGRESLL